MLEPKLASELAGESGMDPSSTMATVTAANDGATDPALTRLSVAEFRNYQSARLDISGPVVVLTGPNGAGKTNLLEAISYLSPGRGLRHATLAEIERVGGTGAGWAISARLQIAKDEVNIGTGREIAAGENAGERRVVRIDGAAARGQAALGELLSVSWLTPRMDRLFVEGTTQRRQFLDRMVYAFDPEHAGRVNAYTHALRERARLLRQGRTDPSWHAALEETIAATGVAIAAARRTLVARLGEAGEEQGPEAGGHEAPGQEIFGGELFPSAELTLSGEVETWLAEMPALAVEDNFRRRLEIARRLDGDEPAPVPGPHRGDFVVRYRAKNMPAADCSTGEQKALLLGLVLAHARLIRIARGSAPIMLMDEVAAHLDADRREALFERLLSLGSQIWMTGTDRPLFSALAGTAQFLTVADGQVSET